MVFIYGGETTHLIVINVGVNHHGLHGWLVYNLALHKFYIIVGSEIVYNVMQL
jgi:hypothetical protein